MLLLHHQAQTCEKFAEWGFPRDPIWPIPLFIADPETKPSLDRMLVSQNIQNADKKLLIAAIVHAESIDVKCFIEINQTLYEVASRESICRKDDSQDVNLFDSKEYSSHISGLREILKKTYNRKQRKMICYKYLKSHPHAPIDAYISEETEKRFYHSKQHFALQCDLCEAKATQTCHCCATANYCSSRCQSADFQSHKLYCAQLNHL